MRLKSNKIHFGVGNQGFKTVEALTRNNVLLLLSFWQNRILLKLLPDLLLT